MPKFEDLSGRRFERLKVISRAVDKISPGGNRVTMWNCECKCGNKCVIPAGCLKNGMSKSCGCLRGEAKKISWHLISPAGEEYHFVSLHNWLRKNCQELFQCEPDSQEMRRVEIGIVKAKRNFLTTPGGKGIYKGWKVVPTEEEEKRYEANLKTKNEVVFGEAYRKRVSGKAKVLTKKQYQVCEMLEKGMTQVQIARELGCSRQNISELIKHAKGKEDIE